MMPSVTQILQPWASFAGVNPDVLAHAADRGTRVHRICAARLQRLWTPPVDPECAGYVLSFEAWAGCIEDVALVEGALKADGFCGHPDMIVRLKGDDALTLIDLKTPAGVSKSWRLQLAAYWRLANANGYDVRRVMSLRLRKDGGRPIVNESTATLDHDFALFRNALAVWKYFYEK